MDRESGRDGAVAGRNGRAGGVECEEESVVQSLSIFPRFSQDSPKILRRCRVEFESVASKNGNDPMRGFELT